MKCDGALFEYYCLGEGDFILPLLGNLFPALYDRYNCLVPVHNLEGIRYWAIWHLNCPFPMLFSKKVI